MNVSNTQPFRLIYSLFQHEYMGYLFESFAVQENNRGALTLLHQNISSINAAEFSERMDESDFKIIKLIDALQPDVVMKKFNQKRTNQKKVTPVEFFLKIYEPEKGDPLIQEAIKLYVDVKMAAILKLLPGKLIFEMGSDGEPTWKKLIMADEAATVRFHFMRNEDNTHYFPSIKYKGDKLHFQYADSTIICNEPAYIIVNGTVHYFQQDIDGKKLRPFLNKKFIVIPKAVEETYYRKFVAPLVAGFDVFAKGFEIQSEQHQAEPVLTFTELSAADKAQTKLFDVTKAKTVGRDGADSAQVLFDLTFRYGNYSFTSDTDFPANVKVEKKGDDYVFHKVRRSITIEKKRMSELAKLGLKLKNGKAVLNRQEAFNWMSSKGVELEESGFHIKQNPKNKKRYFLGESSINVEVRENKDWFDILALIRFGEYEIPFLKLRGYISKDQREFELPNGETAVIPESWFAKYAELFNFVEDEGHGNGLTLRKHHVSLVRELETENLAKVTMHNKLVKLKDFSEIGEFPGPENFKGELRPYQKSGYNWMQFLAQYNLGGCLADDMGLGKTIQTLAVLQQQKEAGVKEPSLLVVPTSLVYNWEAEARHFTPDLKIFIYTGTQREKNTAQFEGYDLVMTSYGLVRLDIDILKDYKFNYTILDESQAIKNPTSNIAKAVKKLYSRHRLILTGTPVENSAMDIWSQMSFINPGLLGTKHWFRSEYLVPIEKKGDEEKKKKLYRVIKPFVLRRDKATVAKDLPAKIENVHYSKMSPSQEEAYEAAKNHYRDMLLGEIDTNGMGKSQIVILQGLSRLRQLANHPRMVEPDYEGDSGKLEDVMHMLNSAMSKGHKLLVFSQYVKHLALVRQALEEREIRYAYIDGSTKNRIEQVNLFQNDETLKVFLISLKAGGVGLNLTAADYVFMLDPWWNPAIEAQAIDRAHRIGQDKKVFTYRFITKGTVEEKILTLQQSKRRLATDLISTEKSFIKSLSRADISALFE